MIRSHRRIAAAVVIAASTAIVLAGCSGGGGSGGSGKTLVVDNSFTLKTADPQRAFDHTGSIVDRGIYDTLFTYSKSDLAHPVQKATQSTETQITLLGCRSN